MAKISNFQASQMSGKRNLAETTGPLRGDTQFQRLASFEFPFATAHGTLHFPGFCAVPEFKRITIAPKHQ